MGKNEDYPYYCCARIPWLGYQFLLVSGSAISTHSFGSASGNTNCHAYADPDIKP